MPAAPPQGPCAYGLGLPLGGRAASHRRIWQCPLRATFKLVTGPRIFGAIRGLVALSGRVCAGTGAHVCACVRGQIGFRRQVRPPSSTPSTGLGLQLGVTLGSTRSQPPRASALTPPARVECAHRAVQVASTPQGRSCVRACVRARMCLRARVCVGGVCISACLRVGRSHKGAS